MHVDVCVHLVPAKTITCVHVHIRRERPTTGSQAAWNRFWSVRDMWTYDLRLMISRGSEVDSGGFYAFILMSVMSLSYWLFIRKGECHCLQVLSTPCWAQMAVLYWASTFYAFIVIFYFNNVRWTQKTSQYKFVRKSRVDTERLGLGIWPLPFASTRCPNSPRIWSSLWKVSDDDTVPLDRLLCYWFHICFAWFSKTSHEAIASVEITTAQYVSRLMWALLLILVVCVSFSLKSVKSHWNRDHESCSHAFCGLETITGKDQYIQTQPWHSLSSSSVKNVFLCATR